MAEKLCTLRTQGGSGGAKYTETSLWTNPSPSSGISAGTNVTLSDSIDNYEYIKINYAYGTSSSTGDANSSYLLAVSDFKKSLNASGAYRDIVILGTRNTGGGDYGRTIFYVDSTTVRFGGCSALGGTGTTTTSAIPLSVIGIKKSGGSKAKTVHGTGTMSTSTTTKVSLNFRPDFVVLECTKGTAEVRLVYDSAYGSSIQRLCAISSGGTASYIKDSYPPTSTTGTRISLIENDGFTITKLSQANYDAYGADFSYIAGKYEV